MKNAKLGYQVYSARDDAAKDLLGVLKQIKAMGYDGVEMAGLYGHTAREVRAMLDEVGLVAISAHIAMADTDWGMLRDVADAAELGCKYVAIPFLNEHDRPGAVGFADTIARIGKYSRLLAEAGIQLLYHNHDFEFVDVCGMYGLDFMYSAIDEKTLKTELDMCWVKYAGQDPAAYLRKYAGRCPVVHLKDFVGVKGEDSPYALLAADGKDDDSNGKQVAFEFRPVGYGCQNIPEIVEAGLESGAQWFIVEQDMSVGRPALEAAKMSADYVNAI